jgi:hypothetical protein
MRQGEDLMMNNANSMIASQEVRIRLPFPHPGQRLVRQQAKRFNILCAGRRWRKTSLCVAIAVEAALQGKAVIWGAPTYDQSRVAFQEGVKAVGSYIKANQTFLEIPFPNGGVIRFRSLDDPKNVKGHTADGVIIDEAATVNPNAWYEALRYMLIDTNGWAWLIGTPKGANNWFKTEWDRYKDSKDGCAWQAPTVGCEVRDGKLYRKAHPLENPEIPFSEIETTFKSSSRQKFREEILAEFLSSDGVVFRNVDECLLNEERGNPQFHIGHTTVCGVDWGQAHDFTAYSVVCVDCHMEVELERFNQDAWHFLLSRVRAAAKRWNVSAMVVEYNSIGAPQFEALRDSGLPVRPFVTTNATKAVAVQALALAFERQDFLWLNIDYATSELRAFESKITPSRNTVYNAPAGQHDDTVICRMLALNAVCNPVEIYFT